jgi:hypothetical protein
VDQELNFDENNQSHWNREQPLDENLLHRGDGARTQRNITEEKIKNDSW